MSYVSLVSIGHGGITTASSDRFERGSNSTITRSLELRCLPMGPPYSEKWLSTTFNHQSSTQVSETLCNHLRIKDSGNASFSSVHMVAYFGIHQVLSKLLK